MMRVVFVRLTGPTRTRLDQFAARFGMSLPGVCLYALERLVATPRGALHGRHPNPPGHDITMTMSPELWSRAKRLADAADTTIGRLCRHAVEVLLDVHMPRAQVALAPTADHARGAS